MTRARALARRAWEIAAPTWTDAPSALVAVAALVWLTGIPWWGAALVVALAVVIVMIGAAWLELAVEADQKPPAGES